MRKILEINQGDRVSVPFFINMRSIYPDSQAILCICPSTFLEGQCLSVLQRHVMDVNRY